VGEKSHNRRWTMEQTLQAMLELTGWQAELIRWAIRQARRDRPGGGRRERPARRN
jgi:hypothetical protein